MSCQCEAIQKNINYRFPGRWSVDACSAFLALAKEYEVTMFYDGGCRCLRCGRVICSECLLLPR